MEKKFEKCFVCGVKVELFFKLFIENGKIVVEFLKVKEIREYVLE